MLPPLDEPLDDPEAAAPDLMGDENGMPPMPPPPPPPTDAAPLALQADEQPEALGMQTPEGSPGGAGLSDSIMEMLRAQIGGRGGAI